ncbi:hypothetical protein [Streptomyces cyaneofuscatus]
MIPDRTTARALHGHCVRKRKRMGLAAASISHSLVRNLFTIA